MSETKKGVLQSSRKTFSLAWKFQRFFADCKGVGHSYISPEFTIRCHDKITNWYLRIYPKGFKKEFKDSVSIYLHFKGQNDSDEVTVDYCISVVNEKYSLSQSGQTELFKGLEDDWGWPNFMNQNFIKDVNKGILVDDTLTILCDIIFCDQAVTGKLKDYNKLLDNVGKGFEDYEKLLESNHFSDVTFDIQDNKMHLHKAILMCRNSVFKAMFEQEQGLSKRQKLMDVVEITDVDYEVMKEVFRFIYSGKVENIDQIAKDLLIAADKYAIPELKALCEKKLYQGLTVDNAIECLKLTDMCDTIHLKTLVMEFVAAHSKDIVKKPGFIQLHKQVMHQIMQLMAEKD